MKIAGIFYKPYCQLLTCHIKLQNNSSTSNNVQGRKCQI